MAEPLVPPSVKENALMRLVNVKLPEKLVDGLDELVKAKIYHSRSDAIRVAVRHLLDRELYDRGQRE